MAEADAEAKRLKSENHRKWVSENRDRVNELARNWRNRNREQLIAKSRLPEERAKKALRDKLNYPKYLARRKELNVLNRLNGKRLTRPSTPEIRAYHRAYARQHRKDNMPYRLLGRIRTYVTKCFRTQDKKKFSSTMNYIGCSMADLMAHLESQFQSGMMWEPRNWEIDHIVPSSAFDLSDPEEAMLVFNYKNLQPLEVGKNRSKSDTIPSPIPSWIPPHIAAKIATRARVLYSVANA